MMRLCRLVMLLGVTTAIGTGVLCAQTPAAAKPTSTDKFYAELTFGPTFGHATSASVGAEGSYRVTDRIGIFAEAGVMNNVATSGIQAKADSIAATQGASAKTKQRAVYGDGGIVVRFDARGRFTPYALLGVGAATVTNRATFAVGGTDITGQLAQRGVQLGTDLAGSYTKVLVTVGIGAHVPVMGRWIGDVSYRYSSIGKDAISETKEIRTSRLQLGIGTTF